MKNIISMHRITVRNTLLAVLITFSVIMGTTMIARAQIASTSATTSSSGTSSSSSATATTTPTTISSSTPYIFVPINLGASTTTSMPTPVVVPVVPVNPTPSGTGVRSSIAPTAYPTLGSTPAPMVVSVGGSGNVLLRGVVRSITGNTLAIDSWGGMWFVRVGSATFAAGSGGSGSVSDISVGDFVGLNGTIAQDQIVTVDATFVRDWSTNPATLTPSSASSGSGTSSSSNSSTGTSTTN